MALVPPPSEQELELLSFLNSDNWQVRQVALANLAGYSAKSHPRRGLLLLEKPVDVVADLKRLTMDLTPTAHDAFSCLVNLSDSILVSRRIATKDYVSFLVSYIFHPASLLADLACMLLSNLTKLDTVSNSLIDLKLPGKKLGFDEDQDVDALDLLLAAFDQGATISASTSNAAIEDMKRRAQGGQVPQSGEGANVSDAAKTQTERKSHCNFLASVFANVTVIPRGREYFTSPQGSGGLVTERLFPYTEHPDLIRRGGAISALKNILFVKSAHASLIGPPADGSQLEPPLVRADPAAQSDILPSLLLPLSDHTLFSSLDDEDQLELPEELQFLDEGKKVERDPALRSMLIESLLLLGSTLYGRRCMRHRGVYLVVRELHKNETDGAIGEQVLRLVNILKREESAATMGDREDDDDAGGNKEGQEPKSADQKAIDELINAEKERSEEDMVIEEL
ncbi:unnamed protein product [Parajaminaea phylloscopi]